MKKEKKKEPTCEELECEEGCICGCQEGNECTCTDKAAEYLEIAQRLQADFDNFRKRAGEQMLKEREEGQISVIQIFLPCLDTFKTAKKNILDEKVLQGVEMIEDKILKALTSIGVEKIPTIDNVYDPKVHEAIAVIRAEDKENDIILDEYQAGYKYKNAVIRYAKVIVNKKED